MGQYGMTEYYQSKLKEGLEYQDFIVDELRKKYGLIISVYSSTKYQIERGETAQGIEIKYDGRMADTGNLYIEVAEKSRPSISQYTMSGIYREDNTWLYLIGNYNEAFIFAKNMLRIMYEKKSTWSRYGIHEIKKETSLGFIVNVEKIKENKAVYVNYLKFP